MPFPLKYQPQTESDILGQEEPLQKLNHYLTNFKTQKKKAALIYGPIGCGKTSSIHALAKQTNAEIIELNSSQLRNEEGINSTIGQALKQQSLFFQTKIVLIDEIDNLFGRQDRGATQTITKLIQTTNYPIIMTANDPFDKKLSNLRKVSEMIEFNKLPHTIIAEKLKLVCQLENIQYEDKALNTLARIQDGDLRGALIDLQLLTQNKNLTSENLEHLTDRKKTDNIFQALRLIFKATTTKNSLRALDNVDIPLNEIFLWLDENLPKEYTQPEALNNAYQQLSNADVFNGRIKRQQHWRFLVYIYNFLSAGISTAKIKKNSQFIQYQPTRRILKLWQAKMRHAKKKDLALKVAHATHTSQKQAIQHLPYFQHIFRNTPNPQLFINQLDLSQDEVDWLNK